jgi:hypothetical protein
MPLLPPRRAVHIEGFDVREAPGAPGGAYSQSMLKA